MTVSLCKYTYFPVIINIETSSFLERGVMSKKKSNAPCREPKKYISRAVGELSALRRFVASLKVDWESTACDQVASCVPCYVGNEYYNAPHEARTAFRRHVQPHIWGRHLDSTGLLKFIDRKISHETISELNRAKEKAEEAERLRKELEEARLEREKQLAQQKQEIPSQLTRQREQGESRPKGTDEVGSVSENPGDGDLHGGDGNSGECDAPAQTSSQEARQGASQASPPNLGGLNRLAHLAYIRARNPQTTSTQTTSTQTGGNDEDSSLNQDSKRSSSTHAGTEGIGVETSAEHCAESPSDASPEKGELCAGPVAPAEDVDGDNLDCDSQVAATADTTSKKLLKAGGEAASPMEAKSDEEDPGDSSQSLEQLPLTEQSVESLKAKPTRLVGAKHTFCFGGKYLNPALAKAFHTSGADRRACKDIKRALLSLIKKVESGNELETPRLDGRKLAKEIVSKRYQLTRCARVDGEKALVVLAVDASGSCSSVCENTYMAARQIADEVNNVVILIHSNGGVYAIVGQQAHIFGLSDDELRRCPQIHEVLTRSSRKTALLINWGDLDAYSTLSKIEKTASCPVILLDSYSKAFGAREASLSTRIKSDVREDVIKHWFVGIDNAVDSAIALRAIARKVRK